MVPLDNHVRLLCANLLVLLLLVICCILLLITHYSVMWCYLEICYMEVGLLLLSNMYLLANTDDKMCPCDVLLHWLVLTASTYLMLDHIFLPIKTLCSGILITCVSLLMTCKWPWYDAATTLCLTALWWLKGYWCYSYIHRPTNGRCYLQRCPVNVLG